MYLSFKTLIMDSTLKLASYNIHGINSFKWQHLRKVVDIHDFILIQEHWLYNSQIHVFEDNVDGIHARGISGMDDDQITYGRPYGGCAILWKKCLDCEVIPIQCDNKRLFAVKIVIKHMSLLLCTVYMPCDTINDMLNQQTYVNALQDIINIASKYDINCIVCGGDFNTDMSRTDSLHTKSMSSFISQEEFKMCISHNSCNIDYTYESIINGARSTLDHFIVTENMYGYITDVSVAHDVDNISDHSVVSIQLSLPYCNSYSNDDNHHVVERKLSWCKYTNSDLQM